MTKAKYWKTVKTDKGIAAEKDCCLLALCQHRMTDTDKKKI
jgi:hypothetical protein